MHFIKEYFETTGTKISMRDVLEEMYGGALPVAKSRKTKRKAISKEAYLEEGSEQASKKAKKDKKNKSSSEQLDDSELPTIQEEAQNLNVEEVLENRIRSSKDAATSQAASEQPVIPKKKRKHAIRKLIMEATASDEEEEVTATELVTREVRKKQARDVAALQIGVELAQQANIPTSSITRENVGADAEQVLKAAKEVQGLIASEAGHLLNTAAGSSKATISDSQQGITTSPHTDNIIHVELDSTPSISSDSSSSSSFLNLDDIPLGELYPTINKSPSTASKIHKKLNVNYSTFEPMIPTLDERIGNLAQRRIDVCERLPLDHPFQPSNIQPLNVIQPETNTESQKASEVASKEVTPEDSQQQQLETIPTSKQTVPEQFVSEQPQPETQPQTQTTPEQVVSEQLVSDQQPSSPTNSQSYPESDPMITSDASDVKEEPSNSSSDVIMESVSDQTT
ncbi:hypothetical protein MtrunA17_Chr4g0023391 [Medicago truncatula]|uniref:Uncharacterized protein n=2 Tax=Medicago truncatula TaxID=3880 RepID=A0A396I3K7_MEDTR|nr:hypothetical protein MtrunA17_Chr4g0023391 [Medicago truncatula]